MVDTPAVPVVDFTRHMMVVAAMGLRTSGGFSIVVDSAYQRGDSIEVVVREVSVSGSCGVTGGAVQPVDIAQIPASALPVRIRERATVVPC